MTGLRGCLNDSVQEAAESIVFLWMDGKSTMIEGGDNVEHSVFPNSRAFVKGPKDIIYICFWW